MARSCNGGHGSKLSTTGWKQPVVATGTMSDGATLVAFSQVYPGKDYSVLDAVTPRCVRATGFGTAGETTITIPKDVVPLPGNGFGFDALWIESIGARAGGGALVAGTYRGRWVVAAIDSSGTLDPAFGTAGWTVLPRRGEVSAILQEPSGRILVAGDNGGGGCCTVNHVAALSSRGRLLTSFGKQGAATLPTGEDSGVDSLLREPNGDLLALVRYGNMGCWGVGVAMLTPAGHHVAGFAKRMTQFWGSLAFGAFDGAIYVTPHGFTLAGAGQHPCFGRVPAKSVTGVMARFRTDGASVGRTVRFPSRDFGVLGAFKSGRDTLFVDSKFADDTRARLRVLRPDGTAKPSFGHDGEVIVRAPWQGSSAQLATGLAVKGDDPTSLVIVATRDGRQQIQIVRLHI